MWTPPREAPHVNRIQPNLPPSAYRTYTIDRDRDTLIKAACHEVSCDAWRYGWETPVDESTDLGAAQAVYLRTQSRRTFTERKTGDGITVFRFESGQRCFADHQTLPERYGVQNGDWRAYRGTLREHARPADWIEDFQESLDHFATDQSRG